MVTLAPDVLRTVAEVQDAAARVARHDPAQPRVQGARAALAWLLGETDVSPIEGAREDVEGHLKREYVHADMTAEGILPGDREYGRGVAQILWWALKMQPLPGWLRVTA